MNKRGFTLIELLVGVVLGTMVLGTLYAAISQTQRTNQTLAQRIDVQQNLRTGTQYLTSVLRELNASDGDIVSMGGDFIRFFSSRWTGVTCGAPVINGGGIDVPLDSTMFFGARDPNATQDWVAVFTEYEAVTRDDDNWLLGRISAAARYDTCDDGVTPAIIVNVVITQPSPNGNDSLLAGLAQGSPMRGYELEEIRRQNTSRSLRGTTVAESWIWQRTATNTGSWGSSMPLFGPLERGGVTFTYFDVGGNATTVPAEVAAIGLRLPAASWETGRRSDGTTGFLTDSLVTRVALRNNRRY